MTYPGGKGNVFQKIINLIPPHRVYIEPFVGGGAIALNKLPARSNIVIDIDVAAVDHVRSAIGTNGDNAGTWQFLNYDALIWLRRYNWHGDEFVYADPPYLLETRRQARQIYRYEMCEPEEHHYLLNILTGLPCPVMISGYWSDLYAQQLAGWHVVSFESMTRGGSLATEYLWMNYPQPTELHDYRYLGENFRERERIKRKKARWVNKLQNMPILERLAISAAIAEIDGTSR